MPKKSDHFTFICQFKFCSALQTFIIYNLHLRKVMLCSYLLTGLKPRVLCKSQAHPTRPSPTWNYSLTSDGESVAKRSGNLSS